MAEIVLFLVVTLVAAVGAVLLFLARTDRGEAVDRQRPDYPPVCENPAALRRAYFEVGVGVGHVVSIIPTPPEPGVSQEEDDLGYTQLGEFIEALVVMGCLDRAFIERFCRIRGEFRPPSSAYMLKERQQELTLELISLVHELPERLGEKSSSRYHCWFDFGAALFRVGMAPLMEGYPDEAAIKKLQGLVRSMSLPEDVRVGLEEVIRVARSGEQGRDIYETVQSMASRTYRALGMIEGGPGECQADGRNRTNELVTRKYSHNHVPESI